MHWPVVWTLMPIVCQAVSDLKKVSGDGSDDDLPDNVYSSGDTGGNRWDADFAAQVQKEQDSEVEQKARKMRQNAFDYMHSRQRVHVEPKHHASRSVMRREDALALSEQHNDLDRSQWWGNFGLTNEESDVRKKSVRPNIKEFAREDDSDRHIEDSTLVGNDDDEGDNSKHDKNVNGNDDSEDSHSSEGKRGRRIANSKGPFDVLQGVDDSETEGSDANDYNPNSFSEFSHGKRHEDGDDDVQESEPGGRSDSTEHGDYRTPEDAQDSAAVSEVSHFTDDEIIGNNQLDRSSVDSNGNSGSDEFENDGNDMMQGGGASFLQNVGRDGHHFDSSEQHLAVRHLGA